MALTLTQVGRRTVFGDRRVHIYNVTWDGAYADEGESLTPAMCSLHRIDMVLSEALFDMTTDTAYLPVYNNATEKLVLFNSGAADAAFNEAGADDLDDVGFTHRILVIGV